MTHAPLLLRFIEALRCLPGAGLKTAQRMAFHLLERDRTRGKHLAEIMQQALHHIGHCEKCQTFSEVPVCALCQDMRRDRSALCVVESPADVLALEQTGHYRGLYFVLMGHLSPIDGIGPEELGLKKLLKYVVDEQIQEVILATNPTVEGEATAHYIAELLKEKPTSISRIAHGVPLGGELEYADMGTLVAAFKGRRAI